MASRMVIALRLSSSLGDAAPWEPFTVETYGLAQLPPAVVDAGVVVVAELRPADVVETAGLGFGAGGAAALAFIHAYF